MQTVSYPGTAHEPEALSENDARELAAWVLGNLHYYPASHRGSSIKLAEYYGRDLRNLTLTILAVANRDGDAAVAAMLKL